MRTNSIFNVVFNRKGADLDGGSALLQVEVVLTDRHKKYVSTGIRVKADQWDQRTRQIVKHPTAPALNKRIQDVITRIRDFEMTLAGPMNADDIDRLLRLETVGTMTFLEYMDKELTRRTDIVYATRKRHERTIERLKESGIVQFADLTYNNIRDFDALLHKAVKDKTLEQTTIYKIHGVVKTYIHLAERAGIIRHDQNPYIKFETAKGRHKIRVRLDGDEIDRIQAMDLPSPLETTRDLYLFQMFTGIAYSDLCRLTSSNVRHIEGDTWIEGLRSKSGEYYTVFLLPEALSILDKYRGEELLLPCPPLVQQNAKLKLVADLCGIDKKLTTHTARHTFATMLLRKGVSLGVIQSQLGHTKIETTQVYARMEQGIIGKQMRGVK